MRMKWPWIEVVASRVGRNFLVINAILTTHQYTATENRKTHKSIEWRPLRHSNFFMSRCIRKREKNNIYMVERERSSRTHTKKIKRNMIAKSLYNNEKRNNYSCNHNNQKMKKKKVSSHRQQPIQPCCRG